MGINLSGICAVALCVDNVDANTGSRYSANGRQAGDCVRTAVCFNCNAACAGDGYAGEQCAVDGVRQSNRNINLAADQCQLNTYRQYAAHFRLGCESAAFVEVGDHADAPVCGHGERSALNARFLLCVEQGQQHIGCHLVLARRNQGRRNLRVCSGLTVGLNGYG